MRRLTIRLILKTSIADLNNQNNNKLQLILPYYSKQRSRYHTSLRMGVIRIDCPDSEHRKSFWDFISGREDAEKGTTE
jgi:hypothetical protein